MYTRRERLIEAKARDDARWDKCFVDIGPLGYITNLRMSSYAPPRAPEDKAVYDRSWREEKGEA